MSHRMSLSIAVLAVSAVVVSGCVYAPPAYPPAAGPPGPQDGTQWPVTGNGPSQDATQAFIDNPNKVVEPDTFEKNLKAIQSGHGVAAKAAAEASTTSQRK